MADVRDGFADSLPVLHVPPDVRARRGSLLICSNRRIPSPPIRSLLCCVAAVAGRRQVRPSSCIIGQKGYTDVFWYCVLDQTSSHFYSSSDPLRREPVVVVVDLVHKQRNGKVIPLYHHQPQLNVATLLRLHDSLPNSVKCDIFRKPVDAYWVFDMTAFPLVFQSERVGRQQRRLREGKLPFKAALFPS